MPSDHRTTLERRYCKSGDRPGPIDNPTARLVFVLPLSEGALSLVRDDSVVYDGVVPPGSVGVLRPGERLAIRVTKPFEAVWLEVPPSMRPLARDAGQGRPILDPREDVLQLSPLLRSALELEGASRDVVAEGLATALVGMLMRGGDRDAETQGLTENEYLRAQTFAESRLVTGLDLTAWAGEVGMPAGEFSKRFRAHTGKTPYAWFMDLRIDEAMRLLSTTSLRVVDIAFELGFSSQSHFNDVFRTRVGESPGRWRRGAGER